ENWKRPITNSPIRILAVFYGKKLCIAISTFKKANSKKVDFVAFDFAPFLKQLIMKDQKSRDHATLNLHFHTHYTHFTHLRSNGRH
ncbi:MAG: hypothetical protein AAF705_09360, partial [Bacteroidota bacterium]